MSRTSWSKQERQTFMAIASGTLLTTHAGPGLAEVERMVAARLPRTHVARAVLSSARARAAPIADACGDGALPVQALAFTADVLAGLALEIEWRRDTIVHLTQDIGRALGLTPESIVVSVYPRLTRDPRLLALPPLVAWEAQARMLAAFAPLSEVSLWVLSRARKLRCLLHIGQGDPGRNVRHTALAVLRDGVTVEPRRRGSLISVAVTSWQQPAAALVGRAATRDHALTLLLMKEAAAALEAALEKQSLLERGADTHGALVAASERRLTRLGYDLHDGPIQDVAALAADVRHFQEQLQEILANDQQRELALGRAGDLEARLVELDRNLRELIHSLGPATTVERPLAHVVRQELAAFTRRTDVETKLELRGDAEPLSPSQRIALVRIVQEALANVRDHSGASRVRVSVKRTRTSIVARIADDGRGFDVDRTLLRAAESGRLGLLGMNERVRLLGGRLQIDSEPGGPTVIVVTLPKWTPDSARPVRIGSRTQTPQRPRAKALQRSTSPRL